MRAIATILCVICLVCTSVAGEWFRGEAEVIVSNISPEDARKQALDEARRSCVEQASLEVTGISTTLLHESSSEKKFEAFSSLTRSFSRGSIVKERFLVDEMQRRSFGEGERWVYRVEMEAKVAIAKGEPDPGFRVDVALNQQTFREGEALRISVTATRDCYLTVLNLFANDSLQVLMPSQMLSRNQLLKNETMSIPPETASWYMPTRVSPGYEGEPEGILVIATTLEVAFSDEAGETKVAELVSFDQALERLNGWLIDIPMNQRTQDLTQFRVLRK